jgi:hypothetical protein
MGYMGLQSWGDSDMAADAYMQACKVLIDYLNKIMAEDHGPYNTSGIVNVALIIESHLLDAADNYQVQRHFKYNILLKGLQLHIDSAKNTPENRKQWGDEESRKMHYAAYKRMHGNVKMFLKAKDIT